jgi:hypothetical protein
MGRTRQGTERENPLDFLEYAMVLRDSHGHQFLRSVPFIERIVCILLQFFHVRSDEHLSQLDKVAVVFIVDFNDAPWVCTASDLATVRRVDEVVGADYRKGDLGLAIRGTRRRRNQ